MESTKIGPGGGEDKVSGGEKDFQVEELGGYVEVRARVMEVRSTSGGVRQGSLKTKTQVRRTNVEPGMRD